MARLWAWFLGRGPKRNRLDEDPSSSNRTVNSSCSEIDQNTTEGSLQFPVASAQKREGSHGTTSRGTEEALYSQESCPAPIVHVRLFTPDSSFTGYVTEGAEQEDGDWV